MHWHYSYFNSLINGCLGRRDPAASFMRPISSMTGRGSLQVDCGHEPIGTYRLSPVEQPPSICFTMQQFSRSCPSSDSWLYVTIFCPFHLLSTAPTSYPSSHFTIRLKAVDVGPIQRTMAGSWLPFDPHIHGWFDCHNCLTAVQIIHASVAEAFHVYSRFPQQSCSSLAVSISDLFLFFYNSMKNILGMQCSRLSFSLLLAFWEVFRSAKSAPRCIAKGLKPWPTKYMDHKMHSMQGWAQGCCSRICFHLTLSHCPLSREKSWTSQR